MDYDKITVNKTEEDIKELAEILWKLNERIMDLEVELEQEKRTNNKLAILIILIIISLFITWWLV